MTTINFETLTIDEIKEGLTSRGIEFNDKARKNTLSKLLQENIHQSDEPLVLTTTDDTKITLEEYEAFTEDDPKNPLEKHEVFTEADPKNPLEKHEVPTEDPVIKVLLDTTEETKQDSVDKVKTNAEENDDYFAHMNAIERNSK